MENRIRQLEEICENQERDLKILKGRLSNEEDYVDRLLQKQPKTIKSKTSFASKYLNTFRIFNAHHCIGIIAFLLLFIPMG